MIHRVLPVGPATPVAAFIALRGYEGGAFLFESLGRYDARTRWTFIGVGGRAVIDWRLGDAGDPFTMLRELTHERTASASEDAPPLTTGLVGFLSYETVHLIEPTVPVRGEAESLPDALFLRCAAVVAFDHQAGVLHLIAEYDTADPDGAAAAESLCGEIAGRLAAVSPDEPPAAGRAVDAEAVTPAVRPPEEFEAAVARAREYISAGDCQQIVLSQRFSLELAIDPFTIYRELRDLNPSTYLFYFEHDGHAIVGSSPEALTRVRDGEIVVRPIAGTRPRGADDAEDERLATELLGDIKENAEHTMLVDLARNDIGRVAQIGSVNVETFRTVEKYSHVMHLVSQVRGRLAEGVSSVDALRAVFPAGTVSGAPKVRAMQIIAELEPSRRGPYAGCIGYLGDDGALDMAIVIRTVVCEKGRVTVQAGAGVVYDSDPAAEQRETRQKARAVLTAISRAQSAQGDR